MRDSVSPYFSHLNWWGGGLQNKVRGEGEMDSSWGDWGCLLGAGVFDARL